MRRTLLLLLFSVTLGCLPTFTQSADPAPVMTERPEQTARQALIEMFFGKHPDDFEKHLPEDARHALIRKGESPETSWALKIADAGRQISQQGERVDTFDTGPNILVVEQAKGTQKFEVTVEHDSLIGEADEIELSFHLYQDGQPVPLPVVPRFTFTLQQEKDIWRLTEITAAAHVPLTDSDYLKSLRGQQDEANESAAQNRLTMISIAEKGYATNHAVRGFTCSLSALFTPDPSTSQETPFYDPGQGNEEWNGYRFAISGCEGSPASKYRIIAIPSDPESEMKTYCVDESGSIKFVKNGKSSSCFTRGKPASSEGRTGILD